MLTEQRLVPLTQHSKVIVGNDGTTNQPSSQFASKVDRGVKGNNTPGPGTYSFDGPSSQAVSQTVKRSKNGSKTDASSKKPVGFGSQVDRMMEAEAAPPRTKS